MSEVDARRRAIFFVLSLGVFAYGLLQSLVFPVLPTLEHSLHTSQANVTWILTANLVSAAIATPLLGRYGDIVGKKPTFVLALGSLAVGSLVAALATSLLPMLLGRVIQGLGGATLPLAFGLIRDEFPVEKVPGAVGTVAGLMAVGSGAGIALGGPIIDALDYHWLFWIPLVVVSLATVVAWVVIPESSVRGEGRMNFFAALLLSGWLVTLLLAVSEAPDWGWATPSVLGLFAAAAILLPAWVVAESRSASPLIDMRMMRARSVWTTNLSALLFGVGLYSVLVFVPGFLQAPSSAGYGFGVSISEAGIMVLPLTTMMFVFGLCTGSLARRFGSKNVVIVGMALGTLAFSMLTYVHATELDIYLTMAVMGVGFGMSACALANLIVASVPREQVGVASGMNANIRTIGGAIGASLASSVLVSSTPASGIPNESGYANVFLLCAGATALSLFAAFLIPRVRRSSPTRREPAVAPRHAELAYVGRAALVGNEPE